MSLCDTEYELHRVRSEGTSSNKCAIRTWDLGMNHLFYIPGYWNLNTMSFHRYSLFPTHSNWAGPTPPSCLFWCHTLGGWCHPLFSTMFPLWCSYCFESLVLHHLRVASPPLPRTSFAASLSLCMVGNPFYSSMGGLQFQGIIDVVAPVALLHGIGLSPWITVH